MRIAVINQHPVDVVGGSELQCDLVARGLTDRGHAVTYLAVTHGALDAPVPDTPYAVQRVAPTARAIVAACAEAGADVVYWRMNRPGLPGVVAGLAERGIPLVLAIAHEDDVTRWPVRPWPRGGGVRNGLHEVRVRIHHRRSWSALRRVAAVASQREDLLGRAPVADQRLVRNLMPDADEAFPWPRPYVAWVGSLQHRKRPWLLPDLADAVAAVGADLVVAGGVREPRYADVVAPTTAHPNLHHVGVVPQGQVVGLLRGARALVMTAREEGFANVLLQAWWHGTPTVSLGYDPDGLIAREALGQQCGEDRAAFLDAVARAASVDPGSDGTRARIRAFARRAFDPGETLDALEGLLHDVRR